MKQNPLVVLLSARKNVTVVDFLHPAIDNERRVVSIDSRDENK